MSSPGEQKAVTQPTHMTIRQLVVMVLTLAAIAGLVVIDQRQPKTDAAAAPIDQPMPFVHTESRSAANWFCPGVPASDTQVSSSIVVSNAGDADLAATITFMGRSTTTSTGVVVPARSRATVDARGGIESGYVSALVEIAGGVGTAEQVIVHPAGDATTLCATTPSDTWYFADGFTGADSLETILMMNPFSDATVVDITFVTKDTEREPASLQGFVIPAYTTIALPMAEQGARNEPVLAVSIKASSGRLVAGRVQHYLGQGRLGYAVSLGAPRAATQWWFADGEKLPGVSEQLVIFNPGDLDRQLSVVFLNGATAENALEPALITAPAHRVTILDTGSLATLPDGRYGIVVGVNDLDATNDTGIVVEQVIVHPAGDATTLYLALNVRTRVTGTRGERNDDPGSVTSHEVRAVELCRELRIALCRRVRIATLDEEIHGERNRHDRYDDRDARHSPTCGIGRCGIIGAAARPTRS
ncbi:MAG: hypothetical protein EBY89_04940 [Actinobacteria bacterium]|nr:hypothetical protein [Actinomycetota bacterium]